MPTYYNVWSILNDNVDYHTWRDTRVNWSRPVPQAIITCPVASRHIFHFLLPSRDRTGRDGTGPASRGALVCHISPLYSGAISDRNLLNMAGFRSLMELMEFGNYIMSDRGFVPDDWYSHLTLVHPPFLGRKSQLSPQKVIETRTIARHWMHVESRMGKIKNCKLLNDTILMKSIYLLKFLFYIRMYTFYNFWWIPCKNSLVFAPINYHCQATLAS